MDEFEIQPGYGMLMKKVEVNETINIFVPVHLIKGDIIAEDTFDDEMGKSYYVFDPEKSVQEYIYLEDSYYIGFTIQEEELLNIYKDGDLESAKTYYYDSIRDYCIFTFYNYGVGNYTVMYLNINAINSEFKRMLDGNNNIQNNNNNKDDESVDATEVIYNDKNQIKQGDPVALFTRNDINDLLNYTLDKNYDKVIDILKYYKNGLEQEAKNNEETPQSIPETKDTSDKKDDIDVKDFYEKTKKKIIGQDEAIKNIIISAKMDQYAKTPSEKNRCFIIGPTGTGKTEIVKCLGEYLNKPFIKVDTTQLTTPGYVGGTLEEVLSRLVSIAGGDVKKAENGIITFDEIDKKCGNDDKLFGQGFLYTLLPFLDGTDYTISVAGSKKIFNTSNLTIFASGSFSEIIKNTSLDRKTLGFNAKPVEEESPYLNPDEIFKRASMPEEIIGRFPIVIQLNSHTEESLKSILVNSDISQLLAEKRKFECLGVNLEWEDKYIEAVAKEAIKFNIGARSLKKIVENSIKELTWEILTNPNKYKSATLLEESVNNPKTYKLK